VLHATFEAGLPEGGRLAYDGLKVGRWEGEKVGRWEGGITANL